MSSSLVRKSLELLESDPSTKGQKKNRSAGKRRRANPKPGLTVEEARKKLRGDVDKVQTNLQLLEQLTSSIGQDVASQILVRAGKAEREPSKSQAEDQSAFTEEDFEKFEKEYFCDA